MTGGSGAPLRNESGKLMLPLTEDPSITFGDSTRNYVDKDLRYRTTPSEQNAYRHELDLIVEEKKRRKFNEKFGAQSGYKNVRSQQFSEKILKIRFCRITRWIVGADLVRVEPHGGIQKILDRIS